LGSVLVITNPSNGRSAQVVIGDRGPFDRRRSLDISYDVAKHLGFEKCGVLRLDTYVEEQAAR
jgi:rare lipoprotein A (peptidoglycan hydrolase)